MREFNPSGGRGPPRDGTSEGVGKQRLATAREAARSYAAPDGRQAPPQRAVQRPLKSAFRFSRKALIPSFMSSVEANRPNSEDSKS